MQASYQGGLSAALAGDFLIGFGVGVVGGTLGSAVNAQGILPGSAYGAASQGLISGAANELSGQGSFGEGFTGGAIGGAISGGVYGGIAAANSEYKRSLLFGAVTESGKQAFVNDLVEAYRIKDNGARNIIIDNSLADNQNGLTRAVINGQEVTLPETYANGIGTESNLYLKTT